MKETNNPDTKMSFAEAEEIILADFTKHKKSIEGWDTAWSVAHDPKRYSLYSATSGFVNDTVEAIPVQHEDLSRFIAFQHLENQFARTRREALILYHEDCIRNHGSSSVLIKSGDSERVQYHKEQLQALIKEDD